MLTEYETFPAELSLDYTEHSSDHWHSDSDTSTAIGREKAQEIIGLMQRYIG